MSYEHEDRNVDPNGGELDSNTRLLATLMHLSGFCGLILTPLLCIIAPLIFWLVTRERHPFLDDQGKESLNFQISVAIYGVVALVLALVTMGFGAILFIPLLLFWIIFQIIAAVQANSGEWYRYPWTIRLVK